MILKISVLIFFFFWEAQCKSSLLRNAACVQEKSILKAIASRKKMSETQNYENEKNK